MKKNRPGNKTSGLAPLHLMRCTWDRTLQHVRPATVAPI